MKHEKIFKRENGMQYQLIIDVFIDTYRYDGNIEYRCNVYCREKNKKRWEIIPRLIMDWEYRSLSMEDRRIYDAKNMQRFISKDEIYQAKIELWEKLKPNEEIKS